MIKVITELCRENSAALIILTVAICLDIVSGIIKATLEHDLMSSEFRNGLLKKILDYILVIVAFSLDVLLEIHYVGHAVLVALIAMEFYSVLENISVYVPIPDVLKKAMGQLEETK